VLALDPGTQKCGFAATDALRIAREPLGVLRHGGDEARLFEHLEKLLAERDARTLVVGLPVNADGSFGPRAQAVNALIERLRARFPTLAIEPWDEHLTSKEAEARLRALGARVAELRAERDAWSALVLLDDWLASH
jgi:putative Holliday junction resolvase